MLIEFPKLTRSGLASAQNSKRLAISPEYAYGVSDIESNIENRARLERSARHGE